MCPETPAIAHPKREASASASGFATASFPPKAGRQTGGTAAAGRSPGSRSTSSGGGSTVDHPIYATLRAVTGRRITAPDTALDLDSLAHIDLLCRLETDLAIPMPDDAPLFETAGEVVAWVTRRAA